MGMDGLELGTTMLDLIDIMISQVRRANEGETAINTIVIDAAGALTSFTISGVGIAATAATAYFEPLPWLKVGILTGGIGGTLKLSHSSSEFVKEKLEEYFNQGTQTISPIVLDLDGDGIETTSVNNGVYFDHNADGFKEKTGWVSPNDGLLVLDRNNNGAELKLCA